MKAESMSETVPVALDRIRLNDYNPNAMDAETFRALLKDMKDGGPDAIDSILLRPLDEGYEVVDGEHRTRAARQLKWTEIRARIQEISLEEAMVVNYRKNRERGHLDPVKEGKLYKWWRDEKGLTMRQIGAKFDVDDGKVTRRIKNVETVGEEALSALKGQTVSTETDADPGQHQPKLTEKEETVEAKKLDMLGKINIDSFLRRSRLLKGLDKDSEQAQELRGRYDEKVRDLQVEVAEDIRDMSRREAEALVDERWSKLIVEASNVRLNRERRELKAELEEAGYFVVLEEDKEWGHRPRPTRRTQRGEYVLGKCLSCSTPAYMVKRNFVESVEICGDGECYFATKNEEHKQKQQDYEEDLHRLREEQDKIIEAVKGGDEEWYRMVLFFVTNHVRAGFMPEDEFLDRWQKIRDMDLSEVKGWILLSIIEHLVRPRLGSDTVDHLRLQNWVSATYGIPKDFLLPDPETLPPELQDGAEEQEATI